MKTRKPKRSDRRLLPAAPQAVSAPTACAERTEDSGAAPLPAPLMMPALQAIDTLRSWADPSDADVMRLVVSFGLQGKALRQGDLGDAERMLMAQASTLDVIFNQLARRAAQNVGNSLAVCDAYLRLALKAQSQCRATLETLSTVKNPRPVSFVRQANIANGPQQVNNGPPPASPARQTEFPPIELLEQ